MFSWYICTFSYVAKFPDLGIGIKGWRKNTDPQSMGLLADLVHGPLYGPVHGPPKKDNNKNDN